MKKENKTRFGSGLRESRKRWCAFFVFCLFLPTLLFAKDQYSKKQYMFIPWGGGNGQLSLNVGVRTPVLQYGEDGGKDVYGKPVTDRSGPRFLSMDDNGNFYFYEEKQSAIKKFDLNGTETARLVTKNPPNDFSIRDDEILIKTNHTNKITILRSKDLSIVKEINVPKDQIDMFEESRTQIKDGALIIEHSNKRENIGKTFVFDEQKWNSNGKIKYEQEKKDDENFASIFKSSEANWNKSINNNSEPTLSWRLIKKDKQGNFYSYGHGLVSPYSGIVSRDYLIKSDATGKILFQLEIPREMFLSHDFWPTAVDQDGNVFDMWSDKDGLHINEYQYLNHENTK